MPDKPAITFADSRGDLPQSAFAQRLRNLRIAGTFAVNSNTSEPVQSRAAHIVEKSMVEQDHPHPVPRPTFAFAADVDAGAFSARWEAEHARSARKPPYRQRNGDNPMTDQSQTPKRPADTLREGHLKAAIWQNASEHGTYHSVTLARTYKDGEGKLQDTSNFRAKDMLGLSELARRAHHEVNARDRDAFKEQRRTEMEQGQSRSQSHSRD